MLQSNKQQILTGDKVPFKTIKKTKKKPATKPPCKENKFQLAKKKKPAKRTKKA